MADFIRKGGSQAFQLPAALISPETTMPLNGPTRRALSWIYWDAAQRDLWPNSVNDPAPIIVRHHANDIRDGMGLKAANDHRAVKAALQALTKARMVFDVDGTLRGIPILENVESLHAGHVEYVISSYIA